MANDGNSGNFKSFSGPIMSHSSGPYSAPPTAELSSWKLTRVSLGETFRLYPHVVRKIWLWLLFLNGVQLAATQASSYALDALRISGREDLGMIASIAGIELVFTLVWSSFWVLVVSLAAQQILDPTNPVSQQKKRQLPSTINQILARAADHSGRHSVGAPDVRSVRCHL
jgi:hypothetical protein